MRSSTNLNYPLAVQAPGIGSLRPKFRFRATICRAPVSEVVDWPAPMAFVCRNDAWTVPDHSIVFKIRSTQWNPVSFRTIVYVSNKRSSFRCSKCIRRFQKFNRRPIRCRRGDRYRLPKSCAKQFLMKNFVHDVIGRHESQHGAWSSLLVWRLVNDFELRIVARTFRKAYARFSFGRHFWWYSTLVRCLRCKPDITFACNDTGHQIILKSSQQQPCFLIRNRLGVHANRQTHRPLAAKSNANYPKQFEIFVVQCMAESPTCQHWFFRKTIHQEDSQLKRIHKWIWMRLLFE